MILNKFEHGKKISYQVKDDYNLEEISQNSSKIKNCFSIKIVNDNDNEKLKLLVILSPIFISAFDNGEYELEFLKKNIVNSSYPFALYPSFFNNFDKKNYLAVYKSRDKTILTEDIILNADNTIDFYFNTLEDKYLKSLLSMIDSLIEDKNNRKNLLKYFDKMRDDIVINGRRSIIANGIQAFYLNKYVVVWIIDLINFIKENNPDSYKYLQAIFDLINNLKTPRLIN